MRAAAPTLGIVIALLFVLNDSAAQSARYETNGGMIIGFGGGYSYQKSDVTNSGGFGFDFILGSQIYHRKNAFLGVDWKFRFLAGQNKAYDHRINTDGTYSNVRYNFFTYDVEIGLTLNRLRERTGIVLSGFGGLGITHGRTFTDLYDAGGNLYDYGSIDPDQSKELIYDDLIALSDGDFETRVSNKGSLLPTAGVFLGYRFSRSFTLGVEFKSNFYLSENNQTFGIDLDNKIMSGSPKDRNNYVSLGIRWNLRGGSSRYNATTSHSAIVTNTYNNSGNQTVTASHSGTSVNITQPTAEFAHTESSMHTIRANIQNVSGPENIRFFYNGYPNNNFTYNANTLSFIASVRLREGENSIRIQAINQGSVAEDQAVIILDPIKEILPSPTVEFTSPRGGQVSTSSDRIEVTSSVKNISNKEDIELSLNGHPVPFEFYPISGMVKTHVNLLRGENHMFIRGFNETGSAEDLLDIHFTDPEMIAGPTVRFINPPIPVEVNDKRFPLSALIQNVRGRNNVSVRLNGNSIHNFSFDPEGRVSVSLFLPEGVSTVEVTARNEAGSATESTFITYYVPVYQETVYQEPIYQEPIYQEPVYREAVIRRPPPVINIYSPHLNPFRTEDQSEDLPATVLHVNSKENITLYVNGMISRDFSYNYSTKSLITRLVLREGENIVTISAENESGEDMRELVVIKETRPCPMPIIRLIDPVQSQSSTSQQSYMLKAEVRNIRDRNQLYLTANGHAVPFNFNKRVLSTSIQLNRGPNNLALTASNECGEDHVSTKIIYNPTAVRVPCTPPTVAFTLNEVDRSDATHALSASVSGVKNKSDISITLNGKVHSGFRFTPATGDLSARFQLTPGSHTVVVSVRNACGTDKRGSTVTMEEPCSPPGVSFTLHEVNRDDATHELRGSVSGVKNKADISITMDGKVHRGFQFVPNTGDLSAKFKLTPGSHTVRVSVMNACGTDQQSASVNMGVPCSPPMVSFNLQEVKRNDATHELRGNVSGVKNKADITLILDNEAYSGFQFTPATGELSAKFKLTAGSHSVVVSAKNDCGTDSKTETLSIGEEEEEEEEENKDCAIRINPGNADWQFCLVSPSGTFNREDLSDSNFSYSGSASSLFFMPIAGGGTAMVNGKAYPVRSGQYYLFSGSLNVSVSTRNPGAMGHWSVCISTNRAPVSGNGNNRPESPCEVDKKNNLKGTSANDGANSSTSTRSNSNTPTRTIYRPGDRTNTRTNTRTNSRTGTRTNSRTDIQKSTNTSTKSTANSTNKTISRSTTRDRAVSKDSTDRRAVNKPVSRPRR